MKILLTNDDGIYAQGLGSLIKRFINKHQVTVVAPDRERSAIGHALTLSEPLRVEKISINGGYKGYAVNGTPADCIKLGILEIMPSLPDFVISGINPGANVGVDINYSGTVAAAKEAALYGVPAIAVSIQGFEKVYYDDVAAFVEDLAEAVAVRGLPYGTCLNVNLPNKPPNQSAGICWSRQGNRQYSEAFDKRTDPRNRIYYWQSIDVHSPEKTQDIDGRALAENFISITPIKCDMTDYAVLDDLKTWKIKV